MRFNYLKLAYFKTYEEPQTIHFDSKDRLTFLQGFNEINPKLGSNAVGKSSIGDALVWVFYGKTTRGLKASGVANWGTNKTCRVTIDYLDSNNISRNLTRTWNPISLYFIENNKKIPVTQQQVLDSIKLSFLGFINTIIIPQFGNTILDIKPQFREQLFIELLDLTYWNDLSAKSSKLASKFDKEFHTTETELASILGELRALDAIDYQKDIKAWEINATKTLNDLKAKLITIDEEILNVDRLGSRLISKANRCARFIDNSEIEIRSRKRTIGKYEDAYLIIQEDLLEFKSELNSNKTRYDEIYELGKGYCPLCKQTISRRHVKNERAKLSAKIINNESKIVNLLSKSEKVKLKIKEVTRSRRDLIIKSSIKSEQWTRLNNEYDNLNQKLADSTNSKNKLNQLIETAKTTINPFKTQALKTNAKLKKLNHKKRCKTVILYDLDQKRITHKFWVTGFKEVRFYLLKEALIQLEFEINDAIQVLGLTGWSVNVTTDKLNKDGYVTGKGLEVYITSPNSPIKTVWESWSGGEAQRLKLACMVSLSSLIKSRYGIFPNLEIWDEPTNSISEDGNGINDLLDLLHSRAVDNDIQLLLIDHSTIKYAGFTKQYLIKRTVDNGSIIDSV